MKIRPIALLCCFWVVAPLAWAGNIKGEVRSAGALVNRGDFVVSVEDITEPPVSAVAVVDQKNLRFVPHVIAIQVGTTVEFPNSDPLGHNVYSISPAKRFNLGMYPHGTVRKVTFDKPGVVKLLCNVHLEMSGFVVVLNNRYFAQTGPDGRYRINGVPPGRHRVRCWHEDMAEQEREVEVPASGDVELDFSMAPQGEKHG